MQDEVKTGHDKDSHVVDKKISIFSALKVAFNRVERQESERRVRSLDPGPEIKEVPISDDNNSENVTRAILRRNVGRLINVEYPGIVDNPSMALRTLGGATRVSEVFHHPPRKLELKYRPGEIFCNALSGTGRTTCGLLIKVRRRKQKRVDESETVTNLQSKVILIDLDGEEEEILLNPTNVNSEAETTISVPLDSEFSSVPTTEELQKQQRSDVLKKLIEEEEKIITNVENQYADCDHDLIVKKFSKTSDICSVTPRILITQGDCKIPKSDIKLEPLGVISKIYEFNGLSDFQYLPMTRQENGELVSIVDDMFPSFGDPQNGILYDAVDMESGDRPSHAFSLPVSMSKIDKPIPRLLKDVPEDASSLVLEADTEVNFTRAKRTVYTHIINFRWDEDETSDPIVIPHEPYPHAIDDCKSRLLTGQKLDTVMELFHQRPIWKKIALEYETKIMAEHLKYILPCVAYFGLNGPWRSLWIRLGYDPRKDKNAFVYQLVDYRFPIEHRSHQDLDQGNQEGCYKFRPEKIPPKSQIFYQFCDLLVPEIQELTGALTVRFNSSDTVNYDQKFGFLNEDVMEFCRYCMSRCIEVRLHSLGKIQSVTLQAIRLGPGGTIPSNQLRIKPRNKQKKRIRTNAKSKPQQTAKSEGVAFTFDESIDVHSDPEEKNLMDYFDDDEEEEENEYEKNEDIEENPFGNLENCFDEDEIHDI